MQSKIISRIWHGYTTKGNADTYESLLRNEIFVGIANKNISYNLTNDLLQTS